MDPDPLRRALRLGLGTLGLLGLANCSGSTAPSGGGGAGGGGVLPTMDFQSNYDRVSGLVPTSDMPMGGTGRFAGSVRVDSITPNASGTAVADVAFEVDFGSPGGGAITGSASNFRGTANGQDFTYDGTLNADPLYPTALAVTDTPVQLPAGGTIRVRAGSASIPMYGQYDTTDAGSEILMVLGGTFVGSGAQAIHGPASVQQIQSGNSAAPTGTGEWFADRR